jgi:hypothetical protein
MTRKLRVEYPGAIYVKSVRSKTDARSATPGLCPPTRRRHAVSLCLVERLVHSFDHRGEALFGGAGTQPEKVNLAVEGRRVGKHATVSPGGDER